MKNKIAKWYNQGLWTAAMVANAVKKGDITTTDYEEITSTNADTIPTPDPDAISDSEALRIITGEVDTDETE